VAALHLRQGWRRGRRDPTAMASSRRGGGGVVADAASVVGTKGGIGSWGRREYLSLTCGSSEGSPMCHRVTGCLVSWLGQRLVYRAGLVAMHSHASRD
jgi:hypothetical protein